MSSSFFTAIDGGDPEIISCGKGMPTGGGAGGNTDRQEGQKDFVSHNKVFVDLSSDTGILLRVFAAVVSKAISTKGLEVSWQTFDKDKRSFGLF